jgi:hypothetical protein
MVTGSHSPSLIFVVDTLVFDSVMGTSGKDEKMSLDNQSDVSIPDHQLTDVWTMNVEVTPLLRTDSVTNATSTHYSNRVCANDSTR